MSVDPHAPPLAGLVVLDFSRMIAGPFMTQMLADMGAEVIKVEPPGVGDDMRVLRPAGWTKDAPGFVAFNRNKRSIEIDIANEAGQALVRELAAKADVLVENYRPDVMEKYGLDQETLRALNPRLIYCSISGYGHDTPFRLLPGYDPIAQAEAGMMYLTGSPKEEPQKAGGGAADSYTALNACVALLGALQARNRTGRGQHVDVSLFDSMLSAISYMTSQALMTGEDPERVGNMAVTVATVGTFECADGPIMLAVVTERQWRVFANDVLQSEALANDPRFATSADRLKHRDAVKEGVEAALKTQPRSHWAARMREFGVPAGAVRTPLEAVRSPEAEGRGMIAKVKLAGEDVEVIGSPFRFSDTPVAAPDAVPGIGEHTDAILADALGYDAAAIDRLRAAGAFGKAAD